MAGFWDDANDPLTPYLGAFGARRLTGRGRGSPAGLPWQARDVSPFTLTRERVADELEGNPQLQRKLDMNTTAEVGTDPIKRRWYQALTIDRAVATGKPLDEVVNEGGTMPYARAMGYGGPERTAIGPQGPQGDETAQASGLLDLDRPPAIYPRPEGRGRTMAEPRSLMDMFQPSDPSGAPVDFTQALASRQNALIGLGMGLMGATRPGLGEALQGFQAGTSADARQQALREATTERKQAQSNWERQFARSGESDWARIARELQLKPGSPEYLQGAKQYYQSKTEGDWAVQTDEETGRPYAFNKRTLETKPLGLPGATAAAPGAEPVPGAIPPAPAGADRKEWKKEQTKLAVQQAAAAEARKKQGASIDPVTEDIDRSIAQISKYPGMTTGGFSSVLKKIPLVGSATQAGEVESLINTVKSSSSLEKLQQMRAQSPSGASGLGAVTQGEHKLLQDAIGSLDQSQDAASVLYNLERIKRIRHEIIHGPGTAPPPRYAPPSYQQTPGAASKAPAAAETRQLGGKTYRKLNGQWFED
jgi:hypothetical protein